VCSRRSHDVAVVIASRTTPTCTHFFSLDDAHERRWWTIQEEENFGEGKSRAGVTEGPRRFQIIYTL